MRTIIATLSVATLIGVLTAAGAQAAPTQINVRIEGKSETLFEGPIWTEGHYVQASSDTQERPCDGTNDGAHRLPGPTPTAASVDAMSLIGETFDGRWYGASSFDDYFITRWGPDEQSPTEAAYWGILVNNVFTNVGGCQYELSPGSEVLWVYDAFKPRAFLALLAADDHYSAGTRPLTATAQLGKPFEVEVVDYADQQEDQPPAEPKRAGSSAYAGAEVSPVATNAKGFERVEIEDPSTQTTDAQGKASITFDTPGWHRIKATAFNAEGEEAVRSNRLDICVPAEGASTCPDPFPEDQVRRAPHTEEQAKREAEAKLLEEEAKRQEAAKRREAETKPIPGPEDKSEALPPTPAPPTLTTTPFNGGMSPQSSTTTGRAKSSVLHMDGRVLTPLDDRAPGLHYRGHWRRLTDPAAWLETLSSGTARAQVSLRLGAGGPVFILRDAPHAAKLEVRAGSHHEVFVTTASATDGSRLITATARPHAGTVSLRVLKGTVDLDGVAVEP